MGREMIDALFGSKTRVKLLHLFLNNPERSFYVREITRKVDEQINSVRRELANMLNVGIITTSENSSNNRLYYEVNKAYPHFASLRDIFSNTTAAAGSITHGNDWEKRLKPLGDVRVCILSGSLTGDATSDVDILLVGSMNKPKLKRLIKELEEEEGKSLNYSTMDYHDFYYRLSIKDRFITTVLNGKHIVALDTEGIINKAT